MIPNLGFPPLDSDHRHLLEMLADLIRAAAAGADADLLEDQSLEVTASLESHFAKEERMLEEVQDPSRLLHAALHAQLLERMARLTGAHLSALGPLGAKEVLEAIARDLIGEIARFDVPAVPAILKLQKT